MYRVRTELRAKLVLCLSNLLAEVLVKSLSPDDVPSKGFSLSSISENSCYIYEARCSNCFSEDILTLGSILNEVILLSDMVRRTIEVVEGCKSF